MQRYLLLIDDLSTWVGKTFSWCIILLTFATSYDVVMRYVFSAPTGWAFDTEYILYGTLFMMAGAYTLSQDAHVRGDFISRLLPFKVRASIELACLILFFFPAMLALLYSGYEFFHISWLQNEHSPSSPTGPPIYPFKAIIPLAAIFMLLQGVVETLRSIITLRTGKAEEHTSELQSRRDLVCRLLLEKK